MRSGESSDHPPPERHPSAGSFEPQILSLTRANKCRDLRIRYRPEEVGNLSFCGYRGVPSIALLGRERVQPIAPYNLGKQLADWCADDTIVFADRPNGVMRVSASGSQESLIKKPDIFVPQILPDGKSLLYTTASRELRTMVQPLKSGETKDVLAGWLAGYLPTGHIIYWPPDDNTPFSVPFDLERFEVAGAVLKTQDGIDVMPSDYFASHLAADSL